jgi:hypothetical protein
VSQNALKVANVVRDSKVFTKTIGLIQDKIKSDFAGASDYTKVFEHLRPIYEAGKTWDVKEYTSREHTGTSVRQDLVRVSGWERDVEKMKPQQIVGTLYVESRKLRQSFTPTIEGILSDIKSVLVNLASLTCEKVLSQYKDGVTQLTNRPETVSEFARYIEKNNELDEKRESMKHQKESVEEMYKTLETYNVKISTDASVQFDELHHMEESFSEERDSGSKFRAEKINSMTRMLNSHIERLTDTLKAIQDGLSENLMIDPSADVSKVLGHLERIWKNIEKCRLKSEKYRKFRCLFDASNSEEEFEPLRNTVESFQRRDNLWKAVKRWNEVRDGAMNSDFVRQVNAEKLDKDIQILFKDAYL